jgi:glycosyltransferase involved in cell wall biosynthesis
MSERARIAVVVPCFEDGEFVEQTVASIEEREPVEIVVVDDCSTDPGTLEALARIEANGIPVVRLERNQGVGAARNGGLAATSAPFLFTLDSDDLAVPGLIGAMADRLDANPEAVVAYGDYDEFGDHELLRAVPPAIDAFRLAYRNEYPPTALFRRAFLETAGGWDAFRYRATNYEDWDLWMTIAERGERGVYMGAGVATYRQRVHGFRLLEATKRNHVVLYRRLRERHAALFADIRRHRRGSDMSATRKALYPVVFGGRRRYDFEPRLKELAQRATGRGSGRR